MSHSQVQLLSEHRATTAKRQLAEANEELSLIQIRDYPTQTKKMLAQKAWNARMKALIELQGIDIE